MTDDEMKGVAHEALLEAIEKGGGLPALAGKLGLRYQSLQGWVKTGRVPVGRVLEVEALTRVRRQRLRPDIYPPRKP